MNVRLNNTFGGGLYASGETPTCSSNCWKDQWRGHIAAAVKSDLQTHFGIINNSLDKSRLWESQFNGMISDLLELSQLLFMRNELMEISPKHHFSILDILVKIGLSLIRRLSHNTGMQFWTAKNTTQDVSGDISSNNNPFLILRSLPVKTRQTLTHFALLNLKAWRLIMPSDDLNVSELNEPSQLFLCGLVVGETILKIF